MVGIICSISYTETAILGLLYEHPHYAERLVEIIEKREMRNWAEIEFSSIKHVLKKLQDKNLIKYEIRDSNTKKLI